MDNEFLLKQNKILYTIFGIMCVSTIASGLFFILGNSLIILGILTPTLLGVCFGIKTVIRNNTTYIQKWIRINEIEISAFDLSKDDIKSSIPHLNFKFTKD